MHKKWKIVFLGLIGLGVELVNVVEAKRTCLLGQGISARGLHSELCRRLMHSGSHNMPTLTWPSTREAASSSLLSVALPRVYRVWLDGQAMGHAPISYIRIFSGKHHLRIVDTRFRVWKREKVWKINIPSGRHLSLVEQRGRFGFRFQKGSHPYAVWKRWEKGQFSVVRSFFPGKHCFAKRCFFLVGGDLLYQDRHGKWSLQSRFRKRTFRSMRPSLREGYGWLTLHAFPPGLFVDRQQVVGLTPLFRYPLVAKPLRLRLHNRYLNVGWQGDVLLKAGEHRRLVVTLRPKAGGSVHIFSRKPRRLYINGMYRGWTPRLWGYPSKLLHVMLRDERHTYIQKLRVQKAQHHVLRF
ncbi:MAG: hypothetical protein AAGJ35_06470 [Myxococcota bacterium]